MQAVIDREALPAAAAVCQVKPAELGEQIGDFASLSIAASC
jgi:glucokinase